MRRFVEIAHDNRHLRSEHGFLVIDDTASDSNHEVGRVPYSDIEAVITQGHGITYTNGALVRLAQSSIPLVLSNHLHQVEGMLLTSQGNSLQAHRFEAQIAATKPTNKRIWSQIVRAKVLQQAFVLEAIGESPDKLRGLGARVTSGDQTNIEAQAARAYWPTLFGRSFRRDRAGSNPNGFLNYGYTILRATTARAVLAAGLHPSIGVHHSNDSNAMRLVDDLVEPFRPFVDLQAWLIWQGGSSELDRGGKEKLVEVMTQDLQTASGISPIGMCVQTLATSVVQVYRGETIQVSLPKPQIPAAMLSDLARVQG